MPQNNQSPVLGRINEAFAMNEQTGRGFLSRDQQNGEHERSYSNSTLTRGRMSHPSMLHERQFSETGQQHDAVLSMLNTRSEHTRRSRTQSMMSNADDLSSSHRSASNKFCEFFLLTVSIILFIVTFPIAICISLRIVQEYERAVIFRLGHLVAGIAKGPGLFFILPCIDKYVLVDLRTHTHDVEPQEILTKDSVTVTVDAVIYYRVVNPVWAVVRVADYEKSIDLVSVSILRNVLGTRTLTEILAERETVSKNLQNLLDDASEEWGVKVERVEIKNVQLPIQLQRSMATEAEAAREARAKIIAAEGEHKASWALKEAADVINKSRTALHLRYLQTLTAISQEKNSTIVFPIPVELFQFLPNQHKHFSNNDTSSSEDEPPPIRRTNTSESAPPAMGLKTILETDSGHHVSYEEV